MQYCSLQLQTLCPSLVISTMTYPSWTLHSMDHSLTELDKAVVHVINLIIFCDCGFQSVCPLIDK